MLAFYREWLGDPVTSGVCWRLAVLDYCHALVGYDRRLAFYSSIVGMIQLESSLGASDGWGWVQGLLGSVRCRSIG